MTELIKSFPLKHKIYLTLVTLGVLILLLMPNPKPIAASYQVVANYTGLAVGKPYPLPLEIEAAEIPQIKETNKKAIKIKSGDSLATLFKRVGLSQKNMLAVTRSATKEAGFTKLIPGRHLIFETNDKNELLSLSYEQNVLSTVKATLNDEGNYTTAVFEKERDTRTTYFEGQIESSFWNAGVAAGLDSTLIMNFTNIFAWDVDFALDIRKGDKFYALVEQVYIEGEFVGYGNIVAAEFINQDDAFQAVRYDDGRYYAPDGSAMRKSFLRAPVSFKYISSNFTNRRFHPVQKKYKAHRGVDYAANTGTPVVSAGDGKVIKATYDRYNGHHVFIEHGGGITTKYLHFSKRKVRRGQKVKQGQVIGLVGATGLAAGPHLHYEFLVNGVHRNPRTVKLPKAVPISDREKANFLDIAQQRLEQLNHNKQLLLAMR